MGTEHISPNLNTDPATDDIELRDFDDEVLVAKLNSLKTRSTLNKTYAEMYKGGIYALRAQNQRENPDWMSQSANSFREIIFILQKIEDGALEEILNNYFSKSLKPRDVERYKGYLGRLYQFFNDLTHHFADVPDIKTESYRVDKNLEIKVDPLSKEDYFKAIKLYKEYLKLLVATALDMHQKIEDCIANNKREVELVKVFFANSRDSKIYFLSLADETWLPWLWEKGFFLCLKQPAEDPTQYGYTMPELDYLIRMAEKDPAVVAKIISTIPISKSTFNPEVIARFQWIMSLLPIQQIKLLLPKMLAENWVELMSAFHNSGYDYHKIVEKVVASNDYDAMNLIAKVMLTLYPKEESLKHSELSFSDKIFYLSDKSNTGIFDAIISANNTKKEESLKIFLETLGEIVKMGRENKDCAFTEYEPFYLGDVDLFNIELNGLRYSHLRSDLQNFIAACKKLLESIIADVTENEVEIRRIYSTYVSPLPDSSTTYKIKLYFLTRFPAIFGKEIEDELFRVFNVGERYTDITSGAEYPHALISAFESFPEEIKREYIRKVFEYFGATLPDAKESEYRKRRGLEIITYIKKDLTEEEVGQAESILGTPIEGLVPHTSVGPTLSGYVELKSPVNLSEYSVKEIIEHLKKDWTPASLNEHSRDEDFLVQRGAEGLGEGLKNDMKDRMSEYLAEIDGFLDRDVIDPSYVYSILREVDEMLRNKKTLSDNEYQALINFFDEIRKSGELKKFERSTDRSFLADWIAVHKIMTDITLYILGDIEDSTFFRTNRDKFFILIKYLLSIENSPNAEDEKLEDGESSGTSDGYVRGRAFRALTQFVYADNKSLSEDVKALYQQMLDIETSTTVRFAIGNFLISFYSRDKEFIRSMFPKIFPKGIVGKEYLFIATWEGYLANGVEEELFEELKDYYLYSFTLKKEDLPKRKYSKGIDETAAIHVALAYTQFSLKEGDAVFDTFWSTPNETAHEEFVSLMGQHYLTRSNANEWLKDHNVDKNKIITFWNWILHTPLPIGPKVFAGFGFWINPDEEVIEKQIIIENISTSLRKSNGEISWEYGLIKHLNEFAKINPQKTLEIIESLLLLNDNLNPHHHMYFDAARQIEEPMKTIYQHDELKPPVTKLINNLIEKGSSVFWGLKDVLK